jgi:hypothetical protein
MDPDGADAFKIAEAMAKHNGYPVIKDMGYSTPGSLGTWLAVDQGIATITLELRDFQPEPELWQTHRDALLAAIEYVKSPEDVKDQKSIVKKEIDDPNSETENKKEKTEN